MRTIVRGKNFPLLFSPKLDYIVVYETRKRIHQPKLLSGRQQLQALRSDDDLYYFS